MTAAHEEFRDIYTFLFENIGVKKAESVARAILKATRDLLVFPEIGHKINSLPGYREWIVLSRYRVIHCIDNCDLWGHRH